MTRRLSTVVLLVALIAASFRFGDQLYGHNASAAAAAAPGYGVSDFAAGFASWAPPPSGGGPVGMAFDPGNNLYVMDIVNGFLYRFGPAGGAASASTQVNSLPIAGAPAGLAFSKDGRLYLARQSAADVVELSPTNGSILRTVATGLPGATGIATDPISGDLFVTLDCGSGASIRRVSPTSTNPVGGTAYSSAGCPSPGRPDGITFGPDGTMYVALFGVSVVAVSPTNSATPGAVVHIADVSGSDGIAIAAGTHVGQLPILFANRNNGTITKIDTSTSSIQLTDIVTGGSRGDFIAVGNDGCLFATQTDRILKVTNADKTCSFVPTSSFVRDYKQDADHDCLAPPNGNPCFGLVDGGVGGPWGNKASSPALYNCSTSTTTPCLANAADPKSAYPCPSIYTAGCALSAAADVLYSYGKTTIPGSNTPLDPTSLNNYMAQMGFHSGCGVSWEGLATPVDKGGFGFSYTVAPNRNTPKITTAVIHDALNRGNLPILGLRWTDYERGTASGGSPTTLSDASKNWTPGRWATYTIQITSGTGAGQTQTVRTNSRNQITVSAPWTTPPDSSSGYLITKQQTHFVVAYDYDATQDDVKIVNPWIGSFSLVNVSSPHNVFSGQFLKDAYPSTAGLNGDLEIYQMVEFKRGGGSNFSSWSLRPHSPVQLLITDSQGRQTGFIASSGAIVEDIPGTAYFAVDQANTDPSGETAGLPGDAAFYASEPLDGTFIVQVIGTGTGPYALDFRATNATGDSSVNTLSGNASPGSIDEFKVTFNASAGGVIQPVQLSRPSSLRLDGSAGYAEAPNRTELNITSDWTIETWFKDESPLGFNHDYVTLLNKGDREANSEAPYFISLGYKRLVAGLRSNWTDRAVSYDLWAGGVDPKAWHHVAASFAASTRTLTLYLDGVQVARGTLASLSKGNSLPVEIGRNGATSGKYLTGKLDDMRIWNVVRSSSAVATNFKTQLSGPQLGLVANWHFDEGSGTTAADSAANHDASLNGGATFSSDVHP